MSSVQTTASHANGWTRALRFLRIEPSKKVDQYRPDIDGLRAIAVLLVIAFHYFPRRVEAGFIGVDVFFVVSGYLITNIILRRLETNTFSLRQFWEARILRLFPSLVTVLITTFIVTWFFFTADEYKSLGKHLAASAIYVSNFAFWYEAGYFADDAVSKPLLHLWSLAVEEQFYLIWPLVLIPVVRYLTPNIAWSVCVLVCASFLSNLYFLASEGGFAYYMPFTRAWQLLAGAGLATYLHSANINRGGALSVSRPDSQNLKWLPIAGLLLIAGAVIVLDDKVAYPGYAALLPTLGTLFLLAPQNNSLIQSHLLSNRILVGIGLISYPLYLWHWPILSIATTLGSKSPSGSMKIALLVLTALLSWLTYRWIESPLRRQGTRRNVPILLGMMLAVGIAGAATYAAGGLPQRYVAANHEQAMRNYQRQLKQFEFNIGGVALRACSTLFPGGGWCLASIDAPATAALIGDSHAHHFFPGLSKVFAGMNENLALLGNAGCPPILDISSRDGSGPDWCKNGNNFIHGVAKNEDLKIVVLAANWHLYVVGKRFADKQSKAPYWKIHSTTDSSVGSAQKILERQFERTLTYLLENDKTVYVLKQAPELDFDPRACIKRPRSFAAPVNCRVERKQFDDYASAYYKILEPILRKYPSVRVIDPVDTLCRSDHCPGFISGKSVYRDRVHLSQFGSQYLADKLAESQAIKRDR